jgi:hypothetical protein
VSTTAIEVINDAAIAFGDPGFSRVSQAEWLLFLNRTLRAFCSRINVIERTGYFDLVADNELYAWPEDATLITGVGVTDTPEDIYSFRYLREMVKEEFRRNTSAYFPVGPVTHYYPARQYFSLYPRPATTVEGGGLIEYYGIPANLISVDAALETPDFCRDYLSAGMTVWAHRKAKELDEAQSAERVWLAAEPELASRLEDRTDDRRKSLRPNFSGGRGGQI